MTPFLLAMALAASSDPRAAVVAAENAWGDAEVTGNVDFLEGFLAPDYVSVSANGNSYTKAQIEQGAKRHAAENPNGKAVPLDPSTKIDILGTVAIVHMRGESSISIDVLNLRAGRWIAVYSQHSPITGQPDRRG